MDVQIYLNLKTTTHTSKHKLSTHSNESSLRFNAIIDYFFLFAAIGTQMEYIRIFLCLFFACKYFAMNSSAFHRCVAFFKHKKNAPFWFKSGMKIKAYWNSLDANSGGSNGIRCFGVHIFITHRCAWMMHCYWNVSGWNYQKSTNLRNAEIHHQFKHQANRNVRKSEICAIRSTWLMLKWQRKHWNWWERNGRSN